MLSNVKITKGACDWRIYQQIDGYAVLDLEGVSIKYDDAPTWVRVVREDDLSLVINWTQAEITGEKTDEDGTTVRTFKISLRLPAGGLYRIDTTVSGGITGIDWSAQGQKIYHIGVGDLFVITGQSNSAGYGRTPVADAPELGVHLCKNSEVWTLAAHPMNDPEDTKHTVNREPASGHSPYLSFAKMMKKELGYPIGLIQESLGGSPISRWNKKVNGDLYNSMVESVCRCTDGDMRVAGILWYQGCSDANENDSAVYYTRFKQMVEDMRADFKSPDLPVYTVQLNKVHDQENIIWADIREIQRLAAIEMKNVFVVPSLDLALNDGIHNSSASNIVIGERLARVALEGYYKKPCCFGLAPDIVSAVCDKNALTLTFSNVYHYMHTLGVTAENCGFVVEDDNGKIDIVGYNGSGDKIYLKLERTLLGKAYVSFAQTSNLRSAPPYDAGSGLPIIAFNKKEIENV